MTDGVNTVPNAMPPQFAGELAKSYGIKVYTIGIGTNGFALFPQITSFGIQFFEQEVQIDEATLSEIVTLTGGKYYRATSNTSLENVYNEINSLEKSKIKTNKIYNYEEYFSWVQKFLQFSKYIILSALIIALARPRTYTIFSDRDETKGIDIFLAIVTGKQIGRAHV